MKKITALFLSFLMVAMLLPFEVWALEFDPVLPEEKTVAEEELVSEEPVPKEESAEEDENPEEESAPEQEIGFESLDAMTDAIVPADIRLKAPL
ncbi:MAG: hypothetical protein IJA17_01380, partial [Oscillospiraceae bacterium]|nr:hypothetical protein [Oscillospiraceae bacterium]